MNNQQSPLVPQGQLLDAKSKGRARFKVAVFSVLAVHGVALIALLIAGCRREEAPPATVSDYVETNNVPLAPSIDDTNVVADTNYVAPTLDSSNMPMDAVTMPATNSVTTAAPEQLPAPVQTGGSEYKVAKGDTFSSIASKMGVSVRAITEANPNVNPSRLQIGQALKIPAAGSPGAEVPKTTDTTATGSAQTYTVKSGDNLTKVAAKFGVSVKALRTANNLSTDRITVGQKLKIPAKGGQ